MENKGEVLPVPVNTSSGGKGNKGVKKEEQYKIMFSELEKFLASHVRSERHRKVLDCLLEVRNKPLTEKPIKDNNSEKVELDVAIEELEKYSSMTAREKSDFEMMADNEDSNDIVMISSGEVDSGISPAHKKSKGISLMDIWTAKTLKENSRNTVFAGRRKVGEKAKLYLNFERKEKDD